jgi:type IV secretory pathway VirB6-like protein
MQDYFSLVFDAITDLLTHHSTLFMNVGMNLFRGFAIILLAWFGIKSALASASGGAGFRLDHFASLLMTIAFGFAMIRYYNTPIPGFGQDFHHLITDQAREMANSLNVTQMQEIHERMAALETSLELPTMLSLDVVHMVRYFITELVIILAQFAAFGVIAYGYVAMAVTVLVGPLFIPFFIVPHLEWLFWGWLKCFIQYAFYQVIANAFVFVFGNMLIHFLDLHPGAYSSLGLAKLFVPLLLVLVSFVYGLVKIPSLVNSVFTGRSGDSALPRSLT